MKIWIMLNGERRGPYTPDSLPISEMSPLTPVWYDGLTGWMAAGEAPLTQQYFGGPSPEAEPQPQPAQQPPTPTAEALQVSESRTTAPEPARMQQPAEKCPPTFLVWSILLTICCCNPVGIIPILLGASVTSNYRNNNIEAASRTSYITEWWIAITLVLGLIMLPFSILIYN